ncbi:hypothetical protein VIOR103205_09120 [Vibrio ordalii]|uniref:Uncharacterized protein n=2 Tax=Vibrionaceae TaxID=641 RepID=A0A0H3ZKP1_VIBSP|nr:hypothetical protein [Vibrio ordalii]AKN36628.1 hypothetical protein [Vibrio splendidus]AKN40573.1 hypothetical protein [Enterovibrio norvegicus]
MEKKSLEQLNRECLDVIQHQILPSYSRAAVACIKAAKNYKEACEILATGKIQREKTK